jgi:molybdopterin converting factor subunit 1
MRVLVRLFAVLREEAGHDRLDLEVPSRSTAEDVWRLLVERHPALAARRATVLAAVNRRYARFDEPVAEGDELAFLPPVSGG